MTDNLEEMQQRMIALLDANRHALVVYERMSPRDRRKARLLAYRCPRGCVLADVVATPDGPIVYIPGYKLSPTENASPSADGRAANTSDGDRRWKPRASYLDGVVDLVFNCDHVRSRALPRADVEAAIGVHRSATLTIE